MVNKLEDFMELNLSSFIKVVELLKQTIEISDVLVNDKINVPKKRFFYTRLGYKIFNLIMNLR